MIKILLIIIHLLAPVQESNFNDEAQKISIKRLEIISNAITKYCQDKKLARTPELDLISLVNQLIDEGYLKDDVAVKDGWFNQIYYLPSTPELFILASFGSDRRSQNMSFYYFYPKQEYYQDICLKGNKWVKGPNYLKPKKKTNQPERNKKKPARE
jgi:hypothetical protein